MKSWLPKILGVAAALILASSVCVWYLTRFQPIDPRLEEGVRQIVRAHPSLQPMLDDAAVDGILTFSEANAIINAAEVLKQRLR